MFWYPCHQCQWDKVIEHDQLLEEFSASLREDEFAEERHLQRKSGEDSSPSTRVYNIVNYILINGIHHDYQDVLEFGVQGILGQYNIYQALTRWEQASLWKFLLGIGGWKQTQEIARIMEAGRFINL